jgi:hypothetical protein
MTIRPKSIAVFAVSLMILSLVAFYSKSPLVFYRFDGSQLLIMAAMQRDWQIDGWDFTSNPLQGIGGLQLPQHNLIDPGLWLTANLPPWIAPVLAMTVFAMELAIAIAWLGTRLGLPPLASAAAVWIGLLLALPYVYPSLGFDFLWGVPSDATIILANVALIVLFLDLGLGSHWRNLTRIAAISGICTYLLVQYPNFAPITLIVPAFFGVVAVLAAASKRERAIKLLYVVAAGGIILLVFGRLLFGIFGFSKATFFWYEFYPRPGTWRDLTFFMADHSRWPASIAFGLALAGTLHAALRGGPAMRPMARGFLAFMAVELIVVLIVNEGWKGPRIAYIDIFAYPFYCVFAAHALATAVGWLDQRVDVIGRHHRAAVVALCAVPWLVLLDVWPPPLERPMARNLNPYLWPPAETPVSKFLASEIALRPGSIFRGRVASVAGSDFEPQWAFAPVITQHSYDVMNLFFSGNDHRLYGLWYFGIPTLIELNQFSSPFFHLVNARLLNASGARDLRSYETQSIVNDRIMALLGVRYLLSDRLLPERTPVLSYRLVEGRDLHVYSVPDTNLAGYAVTKVRRAASGQHVIALLGDPALDPRTTAVLTTSDELPPLVRVSDSKLTIERGGYRIEADSPGTSLLVLPIEYSHCLHANLTTPGATHPRLLRINLTMAGILFSGRVEGRLTLRYGPWSSGCRMEDWREAEVLKIGEARDWPTP